MGDDKAEITGGHCVFMGWEPHPDEPTKERFVAKVEFEAPPSGPLWFAWGASVKMIGERPTAPHKDNR